MRLKYLDGNMETEDGTINNGEPVPLSITMQSYRPYTHYR